MLACGLGGLLVLLQLVLPSRRRPLGLLLLLLGLLCAAAWPLHGKIGRHGRVHTHEQVHFVLGSRYLHELGYDRLYDALAEALAPTEPALRRTELRDLKTFALQRADERMAARAEARARFSPERWEAFVEDARVYARDLHAPMRAILADHGMTGSPSWLVLARLFTAWQPVTPTSAAFYTWLDPLLLLALLLAVGRGFGPGAAGVAALLFFTPARVQIYLGGSLLRFDWLFFLGTSLVALQLRRVRLSGLLLGLAIASKIFCALPALMLGASMLGRWRREGRVAAEDRALIGWAFLGLGLAVGLSTLLLGDVGIWPDYVRRILYTLTEGYYRAQYGLRDVWVQLLAEGPLALFQPIPKVVAARKADLRAIEPLFLGVRVLMVGMLSLVAARQRATVAFGLGVLGIYLSLVTNMYYWTLFGILGLGLAQSPRRDHQVLLGLLLLLVAGLRALDETEALPLHNRGYLGSFALLWMVLLLAGAELVQRLRRAPPAPDLA